MATVTVTIKRQNGVNITATSTDIEDDAVIEIAMMLGALVFDSAAAPMSGDPEDHEPDLPPVPVPQEALDLGNA